MADWVALHGSGGSLLRSGGLGLWWRHLEMTSDRRFSIFIFIYI